MMRAFLIAVIGVMLLALTGAAETYCGIRPTDPDGRDGLANPERGWRFEIGVGRLPEDPVRFTHIRDQWPFPRFVCDGVTVSQAYCYLSQFHDRPVSDEKIAALERDFARARDASQLRVRPAGQPPRGVRRPLVRGRQDVH